MPRWLKVPLKKPGKKTRHERDTSEPGTSGSDAGSSQLSLEKASEGKSSDESLVVPSSSGRDGTSSKLQAQPIGRTIGNGKQQSSTEERAEEKAAEHPQLPPPDKQAEAETLGPSLPTANALWTMAYDLLKDSDPTLVEAYERALLRKQEESAQKTKASSANQGRETSNTTFQARMRNLFDSKIVEMNENKSKLDTIGQDLMGVITKTIDYSKELLSPVLDASPYPSMALAGICLLFTPVMNVAEQRNARIDALFEMKFALDECSLRANDYQQHLDSIDKASGSRDGSRFDLLQSYADALQALFQEILHFQAVTIRFLFRAGFARHIRDATKWNDWTEMLTAIQKRLGVTRGFDGLLQSSLRRQDLQRQEQAQNDLRVRLDALYEQLYNLNEPKRRAFLEWLATPSCEEDYRRLRNSHQSSTNTWLLEGNSQFSDWKQRPHSLLWVHGEAGTGKSVLSSSIIEHLRSLVKKDNTAAICSFFVTFREPEKQKSSVVMRSIIKQLCDKNSPFLRQLIEDEENEIRDKSDDAALNYALKLAGTYYDNMFLTIDAIDECSTQQERNAIVKLLRSLLGLKLGPLHILITSRWEKELKDLCSSQEGVSIDLQKHSSELQKDVKTVVDAEKAFERLDDKTKETFLKQAGIMFQYVALQKEEVENCYTMDDVREVFANAPKGLDDAYARILTSLMKNNQQKAVSSLMWLCYSLRPLTVNELAESIVVDPAVVAHSNFKDKRLFDPMLMRSILRGLVAVDHTGDCIDALERQNPQADAKTRTDDACADNHTRCTIRLVHSSIREFLLSADVKPEYAIHEFKARTHILESCIAYIVQTSHQSPKELENLERFWLFQYSCEFWPLHAHQIFSDSSKQYDTANVDRLLRELFRGNSKVKSIYPRNEPDGELWSSDRPVPSPAHLFAAYDLQHPLRLLCSDPETPVGINEVYDGSTPLHVAISEGHLDLAFDLVDLQADPNIKDRRGLTSLHLLVRFRDWRGAEKFQALTEKLLGSPDFPADPNTSSYAGISALQDAIDSDQPDVVTQLRSSPQFIAGGKPTISTMRQAELRLGGSYVEAWWEQNWNLIRSTMSQIYSDPYTPLAVHNYMHSYTAIVNCNTAYFKNLRRILLSSEFFYGLVRNIIETHVKETACTLDREADSREFLRLYILEWRIFSTAARLHNRLFRYVNRHYVKREIDEGRKDVALIGSLHMVLWLEHCVENLREKFREAVFSLVKGYRENQDTDASALQTVSDSLILAGSREELDEDDWLKPYGYLLERPLIDETRKYYVAEAEYKMSAMTLEEYMIMVDRVITQESARISKSMRPLTLGAIQVAMKEALVLDFSGTLHAKSLDLPEEKREKYAQWRAKFKGETAEDQPADNKVQNPALPEPNHPPEPAHVPGIPR